MNLTQLSPKNVQAKDSTQNIFWDPLHDHITEDSFRAEKHQARARFEELINTPFYFKKKYRKRILWGGMGFLIVATLIGLAVIPGVVSGQADPNNLGLFLLSLTCFIPAWLTYTDAKKLQKQILYQLVAKQNNWISGPSENREKWMRLNHRLPEFFDRGNQNQKITDEFWGSVTDNRGREQAFYSGIFYYQVKERQGKMTKITTYYNRFYAFQLEKDHDVKLLITQDSWGKNLLRTIGLRKKDTDVESTIFNKKFETRITNSKDETLDIFKYLSPIAQDKLVELEKNNTNVCVAVLHDAAFFINDQAQFNFPDLQTQKIHTNFLQKIEVDERDVDNITDQIKQIIPIAHAIADTWD